MRLIIIFCIALFPVLSIAQNSYVELDTITYAGVKVIDQGRKLNALSCKWLKGKKDTATLTPYQVKAYNFGDTRYIAKDITLDGQPTRFFLEQLSTGKYTLYYMKHQGKHFYIENDSILVELSKNFKEKLQTFCSDCENTDNYLKFTYYTPYHMNRFFKRYNSCTKIYYPIRYGVMGGWYFASYPILQEAWKISETPSDKSFMFGAFVDFPILHTKVSIHPSALYTKQTFYLNKTRSSKVTAEYVANIEMFRFPILARYTWWNKSCSPYLNAGAVFYKYTRLESSIYEALVTGGVLHDATSEQQLSPPKRAFTAGGGMWIKITERNALFVELRTTRYMKKGNFEILAGFNI